MKKLMIVWVMLISSWLHASQITKYKETDHLVVFCTTLDQLTADEMLEKGESFLQELSEKFKHTFNKQVSLYIYPDLIAFHDAIHWPDAPDWVIGHTGMDKKLIVSPTNPGPAHSFESAMKSYRVGLVTLFIFNIYKDHTSIPYWLHQGVGLYSAGFISIKNLTKITQDILLLPSFKQIEAVEKNDTLAFAALQGYSVSYSLVEFIDKRWGWDAVLALLNDYESFETILTTSKKDFEDQWRTHLRTTYR